MSMLLELHNSPLYSTKSDDLLVRMPDKDMSDRPNP